MKRKPSLLSAQTAAHRRSLLLSALCSLLLGAAIIAQAALVAMVVSRIFVDEASYATVAALLGGLGAVIALRALLGYMNGRIGLGIARRAKTAIRQTVIHRLTRASIPAALSGQTGGKVSLVMDAVDESDSYFSQYLPRMAETALIPLMLLIVVMTQHWPSGVIMLVTAPFIPIFMILVGLRTKTQSEEKFEQLSQFSGAFLDALQGLVSLKLYGRAKAQEEAIERSSLGFREATMSILRIAFTNTFMMELVVMLSIGVVALELAFRMLIAQTLPFGTAFFILMLVPEFYSAIKNLGTAFHSGRTSMGAVKKVEALLEETKERPVAPASERLAWSRSVPPRIELRAAGFRYESGGFELRPASVVIEPGEQVAIVGASGAGKTT
ncbi:ABC transporter ATP-binding protein/permease, partial [Paenibacillus sp. 598K]|uniref:ABC transporter ATP-binding protein/permease n=1 Tax=Paenibacillus sp. 598K TaxID=1117987 RepID=UPI0021AAEC4C